MFPLVNKSLNIVSVFYNDILILKQRTPAPVKTSLVTSWVNISASELPVVKTYSKVSEDFFYKVSRMLSGVMLSEPISVQAIFTIYSPGYF